MFTVYSIVPAIFEGENAFGHVAVLGNKSAVFTPEFHSVVQSVDNNPSECVWIVPGTYQDQD